MTTAAKTHNLVAALASFAANDSHMGNEGFYRGAMKQDRSMLAVARA